jgi:ABC-2 type transport system ATP-binding protein
MKMSATAATLEPQPVAAAIEAPVAVSVKGLAKSFVVRRKFLETIRHPFRVRRTRALDNVSLDIRAGEFFGLLGSNGAGKTTLFKILATLVTSDEGTATVHGLGVLRQAADVRRLLTPVIADERSLKWRLSARENLRLYATLYGLPSSQIDSRIDEVLGIVGLDGSDTKMVGRFSSGMKQRLLIGRALIPKPQILLLDEPTRSLDPVSARQLRTFLRQEICRRLGCTVLLATHSADEAFELCDRVAILNKGRILHIGATEALVHRFGDDRYRLWTTMPAHDAIDDLVAVGLGANPLVHGTDDEGWTRVDVDVPGGLLRAAETVRFLTERGMVVARFERIRLSLGELIQRVIAQEGGHVA